MFTVIWKQRAIRTCCFVIGLLCWTGLALVKAQSLPTGFNNTRTQDGYTSPMGLLFDGQQQFVWDKSGRIWVSTWNGTQYVKQTAAVLDIAEEVGDWRDFGLLGVALDPNFASNRYVYLYYIVDRHHLFNFGTSSYSSTKNEYYNATIGRLTRYRLVNNGGTFSTDYSSRKVLLGETRMTGVPLTHESHAGGALAFGRDGSLLVSTGDNASYNTTDSGSSSDTYYQTAINDRIMTANENVGAFRSQMLTSLCGKVLRLDPSTGDGISSNPFFQSGSPRSAKSRVWALGFRNPFRMTMQPGTGSTNPANADPGTLLVGDVGWNVWEELHVIGAGGGQNAGWPLFEGITRQSNYSNAAKTLENKDEPNPNNTCGKPYLTFDNLLIDGFSTPPTVTNPCGNTPLPGSQRRYVHSRPALDWNHSAAIARIPSYDRQGVPASTTITSGGAGNPFQGNCVIGGAYYPTNSAFPTAWNNTLFFADYGTNWIRGATFDASGAIAQVREFLPNGAGKGIVDVEYNPLNGSLYYLNINTGEVMKIGYGGNRPPVAVATATSLTGTSPLSVTFTGSGSSDPDGNAITYLWEFGDGTTSTQANPVKVFSSSTSRGYTVKLTVTDNGGLTDSKTLQVSLNNAAPTAKISNPLNNAKYRLDQSSSYTLTANVTDEAPATLTYAWQVTLRHNNHEHREPVINQAAPTVVISPVGCDGETYYYLINLTVTDAGGLTAQDSVKIYPDCNSTSLAVTGLTATTLSSSSVRLNWTNPAVAFDNVLVVGKAGSGFTDKPDQQSYTADPSFTGNGATFYGGKVLYQGVSTSLVVTNLTAGQPYFFRVYTRKGSAWTGGVEVSTTPSAANRAPVVVATSTSLTGASPLSVTFTGSGSSDPDGDQLSYEWRDADNFSTLSTQANPVLTFTPQTPRANTVITNFNVQLVVRDSKGLASYSQTFKVSLTTANRAPVVVATSTSLTGPSPLSVTFTGSGSSDPDGDQLSYEWRDADNFSTLSTQANPVLTFTPQTPRANTVITNFNVQLVVRDSKGLASYSQVFKVSLTTSTTTTPPTSATTVDPSKCYRLVSRVSGRVLGVEGDALSDGAQVRQRTDANLLSQRWKFESVGEGFYKIAAVHSNKVMDVWWGSQDNGIGIQQWGFIGNWTYNQHWSLTRNTDGYFQITARHSSKALEVQNGNQTEGGMIIQYTPSGSTSQQWAIEERACTTTTPPSSTTTTPPSSTTVAPPTPTVNIDPAKCYRLVSRSSNLVLNVPSGLGDDGIILRQNTNADRPWQKWRFTPADGSFYRISVLHNQKGIQVNGSSTSNDAVLEQWTYWGGSHQQWTVQRNSDGFFTMSNRNSGKAITVRNASTAEGGTITQETLGSGTNQQWGLTETSCPAGARLAGAAEPTATFSLRPNPARDHVMVDLSAAAGLPVNLSLVDLTGRSLRREAVEKAGEEPHRFNTGQLPDGLYLLQIAPAGQQPTTLRVLIQQ